jgi:hypothetical protein
VTCCVVSKPGTLPGGAGQSTGICTRDCVILSPRYLATGEGSDLLHLTDAPVPQVVVYVYLTLSSFTAKIMIWHDETFGTVLACRGCVIV